MRSDDAAGATFILLKVEACEISRTRHVLAEIRELLGAVLAAHERLQHVEDLQSCVKAPARIQLIILEDDLEHGNVVAVAKLDQETAVGVISAHVQEVLDQVEVLVGDGAPQRKPSGVDRNEGQPPIDVEVELCAQSTQFGLVVENFVGKDVLLMVHLEFVGRPMVQDLELLNFSISPADLHLFPRRNGKAKDHLGGPTCCLQRPWPHVILLFVKLLGHQGVGRKIQVLDRRPQIEAASQHREALYQFLDQLSSRLQLLFLDVEDPGLTGGVAFLALGALLRHLVRFAERQLGVLRV